MAALSSIPIVIEIGKTRAEIGSIEFSAGTPMSAGRAEIICTAAPDPLRIADALEAAAAEFRQQATGSTEGDD
jgi:hypothetical protein